MTPPRLSGLVVLCRPSQLRAAAVVLSACPPDRYTPLIVIKPAPVTEAGYRDRYERYVAERDRRDALTGLARFAASPEAVSAASRSVDAAAADLTGYRSWWRHQRMVAELLARRPPARAILLFDPAEGDLDQLDAIPMRRIGPTRLSVLSADTDLVRLDADELVTLADAAWFVCRPEGVRPDSIGVTGDTPVAWLEALWCALRTGRPIHPDSRNVADAPPVDGPGEAVLVEVADFADRLIGVQYAHVRNARMVLTPEPDMGAIESAIAVMQDVADGIGQIKEFLFDDPQVAKGIERIESAVSAVVPDAVVVAVGDLDLTAFTAGVPYTFLRRGQTDWSMKAIGHVAGDPALLVLTELLGPPDDGVAGFSLIFDPGFFRTSETSDVLMMLGDRPSRALVLDGLAAANLSLLQLGGLPLDVVYFNTHGSDHEIELADGPLPAFKLQQRQRLRSRPFVFNSSCLSWVGVGREFVRVGARGYAGTLWSVNAGAASAYARTVLDRVVHQGWPIARAMRGTGVDRATECAYIYAGTAASRLAGPSSTETADARIAAGIRIMLNTIDDSLKTSRSGPAQQFVMALQDLLWREVAVLWGEFERRRPIPDADWIEIAALRLRVLSGLLTRRQDLVTEASSLYEGARATLDSLTLDEPTRDRLCAELTLEAGRVELALNRQAAAVALLEDSVAHAGAQPVPALLSLSDALRRADRLAEALAAAVRARDAADSAAQPALSRLLALGRIVQLTRAAGDAEAALAGAREGFALATELDNLGERAKFKGDEARALLTLKRFEDAAEAARVFRALAQNAYDDRLELSACGALVQALTGLGELAEAGRLAELGLAQAQALGATESVGAFLDDVWRLNSLAGAHAEAMDAGLAAASAYASIGLMPRVRHALGQATDSFNALLHKAGPRGSAGALFRKARGELELLGYVSPDLQKAIVTEAVTRFTELVQQGSDEAVAAGIDALARRCKEILAGIAPQEPAALVFLIRAFAVFLRLAQGRVEGTREMAAEADAMTGGGTDLVGLVDTMG